MDILSPNAIYPLLQSFEGLQDTSMSKISMGVHNISMSIIGTGNDSFAVFALRFSHNLVIIIECKGISFTLNLADLIAVFLLRFILVGDVLTRNFVIWFKNHAEV